MSHTETESDQRLTTGWESDAPIDDTILRQFLLNWSAWTRAACISLGGNVVVRDDHVATDARRADLYQLRSASSAVAK